MSDILDDLKMLADHCDQENDDEPCDLGMLLIRAIAEIRKLRQQLVGAAEVPMPEPDTHCYDDDVGRDVWSHSPEQMRTYGEQCRAAGYAAGLAAGGKDAERYQHAKLHGWPEYRCEIHPNPNGVPQWGYCGYWFDSPDAAIDAALRGEVKP